MDGDPVQVKRAVDQGAVKDGIQKTKRWLWHGKMARYGIMLCPCTQQLTVSYGFPVYTCCFGTVGGCSIDGQNQIACTLPSCATHSFVVPDPLPSVDMAVPFVPVWIVHVQV